LSTLITLRIYAHLFREWTAPLPVAIESAFHRTRETGDRSCEAKIRGQFSGFVQVERFAKVLILLDGDAAEGGGLPWGIFKELQGSRHALGGMHVI